MNSFSTERHIGASSLVPVDAAFSANHCGHENCDDQLVERLRVGEGHALEEVMKQYRARIYALAFRFARNHHDAEEIVQETFLRAFRAAPRFRGEASLGTWLHSIATNVARNRYRYWHSRKRDVTVSLDEPLRPADLTKLRNAISIEAETGFTESLRIDLLERIERSMGMLPEKDRAILLLRNGTHAPYAEIARVLGIAMGTVKSRIARARDRLRALALVETPGHGASAQPVPTP